MTYFLDNPWVFLLLSLAVLMLYLARKRMPKYHGYRLFRCGQEYRNSYILSCVCDLPATPDTDAVRVRCYAYRDDISSGWAQHKKRIHLLAVRPVEWESSVSGREEYPNLTLALNQTDEEKILQFIAHKGKSKKSATPFQINRSVRLSPSEAQIERHREQHPDLFLS